MQTKISQFEELKYVVKYPKNFKEGEKFPVLIFLHGAGTRGNDIDKLLTNPFFEITNKHDNFPFIVVAPLCAENTWFDVFEQLKRLVYKVSCEPFTDKKRIYAMGASMGGYCTWQLAMSMPHFFAAIVPICGGGMYWNAARLINVPIWAFHGEKDTVVEVEESIKMVDAVNKCGGCAKITIYPENQHDAWSDTYNNIEVFNWLLSNTNKNRSSITDNYKDGNIYG